MGRNPVGAHWTTRENRSRLSLIQNTLCINDQSITMVFVSTSPIRCMLGTSLHARPGQDLPVAPETGAIVLAIGVVVLTVIAYDIYRQHWTGGSD